MHRGRWAVVALLLVAACSSGSGGSKSSTNLGNPGNCTVIDHGNGLATRYAHASQLLVHTGEVVVPGDRIAMVGSSGRSTGAHLHFEVLRSGDQIDPRRYLAGM